MLHEARMNFQRTIVNRAPRFPCRGAAQFNQWLQATPGYAFLFSFAHWPGAPEPSR